MALANIEVAVTESNISVDLQNTTVAVSSTTSNVIVGTATSARFIENVFDAGIQSGNVSLDVDNGTIQNITLSGNVTGLTLNNFGNGSSITAIFTQSGLGGSYLDTTTYTSNWTNYNFINDYKDFDTNPNNYSILNIFNDGNAYYTSLLTETAPGIQPGDLTNSNVIISNTTTGTNKTLELGANTSLSTDAITEGNTNLFFSNTALATSSTTHLPEGTNLYYTDGRFDVRFATKTSDDLTEGSTNQYFTASRFNSSFAGKSTSDLSEGTNLYYTEPRFTTSFSAKTTDDLTEGSTNLYFTSVRGNSTIEAYGGELGNINNITSLNIYPDSSNNLVTSNSNIFYSNTSIVGGTFTIRTDSANTSPGVGSTRLQFDNNYNSDGAMGIQFFGDKANANPTVIFETHGSGTAIEGSSANGYSLYDFGGPTLIRGPYFNSGGFINDSVNNPNTYRNWGAIEDFNMKAVNFVSEQDAVFNANISVGANLTLGQVATDVHTITGNINVTGNVEVDGNLNYRNVEDLYVTDQKITLNANAATDATVEIIANRPVAGANTVLRWNETDDKWQFSNDGSTYYDLISNTDAQAYIQSNGLTMTADISTGNNLDFTGSTPVLTMTEAGKIRIGNISNSNNPILSFLPGNMHKYTITDQDSDNFGVLYQEGVEHYKNDDDGIKVVYAKGRGNISVPAGPNDGDRVYDEFFLHACDGSTVFKDRSNFGQSGRFVFYDADVATYDDNTMPLTQEFYSFLNGDLTSGSPISLLRMASDGTISFNGDATREDFGSAPVTITRSGNVTSNNTIQGGTLTDGTLSSTGGAITGATSITSTTFTDGTLTITGGNISSAQNIGATGTIDTNGLIKTFGGNIEAATGNVIAGGNINAAGGTFTGIVTSNSNVETTGFFIGDLDGAVTLDVYNNTGVTLNKGEAVYLTGGNQGDTPNVALADSDDATKMPALGIVRENISASAVGQVVTSGVMNYASHGFTSGADLFISTTAGGLTETAPTGETGLIQKIGKVVSANHILVQGAFRTNATPNLNENNIFIGNSANRAETVSLTGLTSNLKTTGNLQVNPDTVVGGLKGLTFDSSTNRLGLGTTSPTAGLEIVSSGDIDSQIFLTEYSTSASGPDIRFRRAEGTEASPTPMNDGDHVGQLFFTPWRQAADSTGNASHATTFGGDWGIGMEIATFAEGDQNLVYSMPVATIEDTGAGNPDRLKFSDQTITYNDGIIIALDNTTNANLTVLNGNAFYADRGGGSTSRYYDLYYDEEMTLPVEVAVGTETATDMTGNIVAVVNPVGLEIIAQDQQNDRFSVRHIHKIRSNGDIEIGSSGTDTAGTPTATITSAGVFTTEGNITTTANISGANVIGTYLYGDGTNISGIGGSVNSFETIAVSGGNSVVADSSTDTLNLVASGAITITADAATDTITIGGSGGTYGNTDVENFLSANVITSDIITQGNISVNKNLVADSDVKAANALFGDKIYSYTPGGTITFNSLRVTDFKANDPLGIDIVANSSLSGGVYAAPFQGSIVYVTGDRNGSDGAPAYWNGTAWKYFSDDANVTI